MQITIHTDGACDIHAKNQPGGWAAILRAVDAKGELLKEKVLSGGAETTTNNQMELTAVIEGIKALQHPTKVIVLTDSRYVMNIATGKMKATRNKKLWQMFFRNAKKHEIEWRYVAGHSGDVLNDRCDRLAVQEKRSRAILDSTNEHRDLPAPATDVSIYISTVYDKNKTACAYAAQIIYCDSAREIKGLLHGNSEQEATLIATAKALEYLRPKEGATVYTAQEYLSKGMNKWMSVWQKNGWKTRGGKAVRYQSRWQYLHDLSKGRALNVQFVKNRSGVPYFRLGKEIAAGLIDRD